LKANTNKEKVDRFQFRLMEMRRNSSSQIQNEPFTQGSKPHWHIGQKSVTQIHLETCSTKTRLETSTHLPEFWGHTFLVMKKINRLNEALYWANFLPFIEVLLEPVYATMTPDSTILVPWREKHPTMHRNSWPFWMPKTVIATGFSITTKPGISEPPLCTLRIFTILQVWRPSKKPAGYSKPTDLHSPPLTHWLMVARKVGKHTFHCRS
jgi:hypothetical protein